MFSVAKKVLIFKDPIMSMSSIASLALDTKDLEENNETANKENNDENMKLNENRDSKIFLTSQEEKDIKETSEVEDWEQEKEKEKKMVVVMAPPTSSDSGAVSDFLRSKKEVKWCGVLLGLRISAFVFCLVSFSVLAANEQNVFIEKSVITWYFGQESDTFDEYSFHWYEYPEFKFSFTANVLGFVYSGFQSFDLLRYLITRKHTGDPKLQGYFTIAIDQALAYVLMSASSTAATAAHLYRSHWADYGVHQFTEMANASVAMSFLAFLAFALTSIVSCFSLSRFT